MVMQTSALRNRNYLLFLAGNTVSLHGLWVYRVALGWYAWQLTESELWVGVVAFTQFFPILLFAPLFGALADRFDRKRSAVAINAVSAAIMSLLAACTAAGVVDIYLLCTFSLAQGIAEGAHTPVRLALVPNLVPREQLRSAMATNSIAFNVSRFVGPALAGVLIALYGSAAAFAFNALSYLPALAALILIRVAPFAPVRGRLGSNISAGVRYAVTHGPVRRLMALVGLASLFGRGTLELLPAFAEAAFGRGATGLATLTSAAGAGAVLAGVVLSRGLAELGIRRIVAGTVLIGALVAALGLAPSFWYGVAVVVLLGFTLTFCGVGAQILLQSLIEDEVRGRVSSLWGMLAFGGTALGGLLAGAAADRWGLAATSLAAGTACLLLAAPLAKRRRPAPGDARPHPDLPRKAREISTMVAVESQMLPLGTEAPSFSLPDPDGRRHSLDDVPDARAYLVMFICNHCPFVKHVRHELARLGDDYLPQGVAIFAINSNDYERHPDDSPERMREEAQRYGYRFPYLIDRDQSVAKAYRAACTPDFLLFDAERRLVYRGQLDDSRPSNDKPVTGADLRAALDAVLQGREVPKDQKPSIGCNIKWRPGNAPEWFG